MVPGAKTDIIHLEVSWLVCLTLNICTALANLSHRPSSSMAKVVSQKILRNKQVENIIEIGVSLQLMIVEAEQRVPDFIKAGSDIVSIHVEPQASLHLDRGINQVIIDRSR